MKKFLTYLKEFIREHYNTKAYILFFILTGIMIAANYIFDIEDSWIDRSRGSGLRILWFWLIHIISYLIIALPLAQITKRKAFLKSKEFWIKISIGFLILALSRSVYFFHFARDIFPRELVIFGFRILENCKGWIMVLIPLSIMYYVYDREQNTGIYGLTFKKVNLKPYFVMLLIMVPLVYAASLTTDFQRAYPVYVKAKGNLFAQYFEISEFIPKVIFEFFYITDFMFTELFFRGFLVLAFVKILGKDAILPMAATYAILHFGKPLGETISSVFGGYILGVIALYSRNIWGGVFIHGGIAFLMELFAMRFR